MEEKYRRIIRERIAPLVQTGEASLLLGAGFSIVNQSLLGKLPMGDGLRDLILAKCGKTAGPKTKLKDAYLLGSREIPKFNEFLADCFTVRGVLPWQEKLFAYAWSRIYTTNIDNVLEVAHKNCASRGKVAGDYTFVNYSDPSDLGANIGRIPVVSIHGTCTKLSEGFIFSSLEYAKATAKILDWHRDLAAKISTGGVIVVGNQLDETDIDAHLILREIAYGSPTPPPNFMVMPNPDEIKASNYASAGYEVIDCTAEDFFTELYAAVQPRSVADIVLSSTPSIRKAVANVKAMTWFKGAFEPVLTQLEEAQSKAGILRHFITGADPEWFYVVNGAPAKTSVASAIANRVAGMMNGHTNGVGVLHVTGSSGSGKTTAIRMALTTLVRVYPYVYEFDGNKDFDIDLLKQMIEGFTEKTIFVFYSAAEYYFAINVIADRLQDHRKPYLLFILEDRTNDHRRNYRQIADPTRSEYFEMPPLNLQDAALIAEKIETTGLVIEKFSELSRERRASIIVDKERGYNGDLLSALFSLTSHQNFEQKIYEEYHNIPGGIAQRLLDIIATLNSRDFNVPLDYLTGFTGESALDVTTALNTDLADVVISQPKQEGFKCRHKIIAQYYFENCVAHSGRVDTIVDILYFLSRKFSIEDIRLHPLPYRIYKEVINFDFLYEAYFPKETRGMDTERTYHLAQKFFGQDGLFWLHFGRYYRKTKQWKEAIDCFRTGLNFHDSFQTKHSLGTALLEQYLAEGSTDPGKYAEGVQLLENERVRRGLSDPYPTSTLLKFLVRITEVDPSNVDAQMRLKTCVNIGLKHFSDDQFFKDQLSLYLRRQAAQ